MFIRPATSNDIVALAQLFAESVDSTYITPTEMMSSRTGVTGAWHEGLFDRIYRELREAYLDPRYLLLCIGVDDPPEFLGYTLTSFKPNRCAEIEDFVIATNARGQGLGKELHSATLSELKKRGFEKVFYEVSNENKRMQRFLRSAGMEPASTSYVGKL